MINDFKSAVNEVMEEFFHKYLHYDVKSGIALIYSKTKNAKETIKNGIRTTDKFVQISKHLFIVFYQYSNNDEEIKAACVNLLKKLDSFEKKSKTVLAYTSFREEDKSVDSVISRLYIVFDEALLNKESLKSDKEFLKEYSKFHIDFKDV